jgi:DNA-binding NtrC family response regulator
VSRYADAVDRFRAALIVKALVEASGNKCHAAKKLGIPRTMLYRHIRTYKIDVPSFKDWVKIQAPSFEAIACAAVDGPEGL